MPFSSGTGVLVGFTVGEMGISVLADGKTGTEGTGAVSSTEVVLAGVDVIGFRELGVVDVDDAGKLQAVRKPNRKRNKNDL
jgi:hypothetical protein